MNQLFVRLFFLLLSLLIWPVAPLAAQTLDRPWPDDPAQRQSRRQGQQARIAATQKSFHNFRFTDRGAASGITFRSRAVDDVGKYNQPIQYDHGQGLAVADVDGDGRPDVFFREPDRRLSIVAQSGRRQI